MRRASATRSPRAPSRPERRRLLAAGAGLAASALATPLPRAQTAIGTLVRASFPAPPLELKDLDGHTHRLADQRGRVVLVNFWATWCVPCRAEMPSMQRLAASLAGRPFTMLAVNYGESAERAGEFARSIAFDTPVLLDAFHRARTDWQVRILPASYLVDRDGRVRYTVAGELDWDGPAARQAIAALMDAAPNRKS